MLSYHYLTNRKAVMTKAAAMTTVSTKGQVILPKALRDAKQWNAGTRLTVEDADGGLLLKAAPLFAATKSADVFCSLAYKGKAKTIDEMTASIAAEARRRHAGR
jgi:AbrB family looped-hinge helix DNA binding protein